MALRKFAAFAAVLASSALFPDMFADFSNEAATIVLEKYSETTPLQVENAPSENNFSISDCTFAAAEPQSPTIKTTLLLFGLILSVLAFLVFVAAAAMSVRYMVHSYIRPQLFKVSQAILKAHLAFDFVGAGLINAAFFMFEVMELYTLGREVPLLILPSSTRSWIQPWLIYIQSALCLVFLIYRYRTLGVDSMLRSLCCEIGDLAQSLQDCEKTAEEMKHLWHHAEKKLYIGNKQWAHSKELLQAKVSELEKETTQYLQSDEHIERMRLKSENQILRDKLKDVETAYHTITQKAERSHNELGLVRSELDRCKHDLNHCKIKLESNEDECKLYRDKIKQSKADVDLYKNDLVTCEVDLDGCKNELKTCKLEIDSYKSKLEQSEVEIDLHKNEIRSCMTKIDQITAEQVELQRCVDSNEDQLLDQVREAQVEERRESMTIFEAAGIFPSGHQDYYLEHGELPKGTNFLFKNIGPTTTTKPEKLCDTTPFVAASTKDHSSPLLVTPKATEMPPTPQDQKTAALRPDDSPLIPTKQEPTAPAPSQSIIKLPDPPKIFDTTDSFKAMDIKTRRFYDSPSPTRGPRVAARGTFGEPIITRFGNDDRQIAPAVGSLELGEALFAIPGETALAFKRAMEEAANLPPPGAQEYETETDQRTVQGFQQNKESKVNSTTSAVRFGSAASEFQALAPLFGPKLYVNSSKADFSPFSTATPTATPPAASTAAPRLSPTQILSNPSSVEPEGVCYFKPGVPCTWDKTGKCLGDPKEYSAEGMFIGSAGDRRWDNVGEQPISKKVNLCYACCAEYTRRRTTPVKK